MLSKEEQKEIDKQRRKTQRVEAKEAALLQKEELKLLKEKERQADKERAAAQREKSKDLKK